MVSKIAQIYSACLRAGITRITLNKNNLVHSKVIFFSTLWYNMFSCNANKRAVIFILMEPIIKIENIKVIYNKGKDNEFIALNDISMEVFPEEYLIFFGPSGCGKSTMLYTILGLQTPTEGKVYINGRDRATFTEDESSKMTSGFFGMVFQNFNLIYSLNVLDNVTLPQVFINQSKEERTEKAMTVLKRFGIETRIKNFAGNLSGEEKKALG